MAPPELRRCSGLPQAYTEGLHSRADALLSLECSHHVVLVQHFVWQLSGLPLSGVSGALPMNDSMLRSQCEKTMDLALMLVLGQGRQRGA